MLQTDTVKALAHAGVSRALPAFYACNVCHNLHPENWMGNCDDPRERFGRGELDGQYGMEGWVEI